MYSETAPTGFSAGLHNGPLSAYMKHLPEGAVTINGMSPHDIMQHGDIVNQSMHGAPVNWQADTGDPQADRDLVHIMRGIAHQGRNPWPGKDTIPPNKWNFVANQFRTRYLGLPEEGINPPAAAPVSGEMTTPVLSNWRVVSLGELQQPGGVGATQPYNPVVDGPNPDMPPSADNANNSPEQEVALQTWVNTAIDALNRGESPEAIIAQLAHDGCPNPQEILERAQAQPNEPPVSDQLGQDPFDTPPADDPSANGEMQGLSQQPPVMAKRVRIAGTSMEGVEIDRWEGVWGETTVKVALDEGGTLNVAPEAVQELTEASPKHPVTEIQQFIDSIPEVQPTRPSIEARLANLELVRRAVRSNISKVGFHDQVKLEGFDRDAQNEQISLKNALDSVGEPDSEKYLSSLQSFEYNKLGLATPEIFPYGGNVREAAIIWATESPFTKGTNDEDFHFAAAHYASRIGLSGGQINEFLSAADEHRVVRTEEFTAEPETIDNEGPAEALFL